MKHYPDLKEFLKLSKKGNVIPVYLEINADLDTPVSAFLKIARNDYAFLFESVEGQEKLARYSFLGASPQLVFRSKGKSIEITYPGQKKAKKFTSATSALDEVRRLMLSFKAVEVEGLPRFCGGLVGYLGYDSVRSFEVIPDNNPDELKCDDSVLMLMDTLLVFDHIKHTIKIVSNAILEQGRQALVKEARCAYDKALEKIDSIYALLGRKVADSPVPVEGPPLKVASNFTRPGFSRIVQLAKNYIRKGDIIQVVLSQRFKIKTGEDPLAIYRRLRSLNPSPYMYLLKLKGLTLVGASPEMLVRCEDGLIQTRPIAGTRPRGRP